MSTHYAKNITAIRGNVNIVGTKKKDKPRIKVPSDWDVGDARRDLIAVWAIVQVCREMQTQKSRAQYLLNEFTRCPRLIRYFRAAMDHHNQYGLVSTSALNLTKKEQRQATVAVQYTDLLDMLGDMRRGRLQGLAAKMSWRYFMDTLPAELRPTACSILDKDLTCGLTTKTVNRVLEKLGKKPLAEMPVHPQNVAMDCMEMEITSFGGNLGYSATAYLTYEGERVANIVFAVCPKMRLTLAAMRAAGVKITCPNYMRLQDLDNEAKNGNNKILD